MIVKQLWPIPRILFNHDGITLYPYVFIREKYIDNKTMLCHEGVHIEQVEREIVKRGKILGWLYFYSTYILYSIRFGYWRNPYEIEAYAREKEWQFERNDSRDI